MKLKKFFTTVSLLMCFTVSVFAKPNPDPDLAKRQCRSVHLGFQSETKITDPVDLFYSEMQVEKSAPGSYFMAAGFSGGYFGIQELYNGKKVALFSVWDPGNPHNLSAREGEVAAENRVLILDKGENVRTRRFGGEGTGAQSMIDLDWKNGETYQFIVTAKPGAKPEGTIFSGYIKKKEDKVWRLMATFHTKIPVKQVRHAHTFVEDFRRNYESTKFIRKAHYGNAWLRTNKGTWHSLTKAKFTGDPTPSNFINAGVSGKHTNGFFLQTGGDTKNVTKLWSVIQQPAKEGADANKVTPPADAVEFGKK